MPRERENGTTATFVPSGGANRERPHATPNTATSNHPIRVIAVPFWTGRPGIVLGRSWEDPTLKRGMRHTRGGWVVMVDTTDSRGREQHDAVAALRRGDA